MSDSRDDKHGECPKCGADCIVTRGSDPFTFHYKATESSSGAASAYGPDGRGVATGTPSATTSITDLHDLLDDARDTIEALSELAGPTTYTQPTLLRLEEAIEKVRPVSRNDISREQPK